MAEETKQTLQKVGLIPRIPSGIPGFDELVQGGFEEKSSILLSGYAGTGKTTFAMQYLYEGAKSFNEPGLFLSFAESKDSMMLHAKEFGWDFYQLERSNMVRFLDYKAHEVSKLIEEGGGTVRDAINEIDAKRLVIDSVTAYSLLFKDSYKKRQSLLFLFEQLSKWGCTSLVIDERITRKQESGAGEMGFLTDGILSFYYSRVIRSGVEMRLHKMEILKMRGTNHYTGIVELMFTDEGLKVKPYERQLPKQ